VFLSVIIAVRSTVQRPYPMTIHSAAGAVSLVSKGTGGNHFQERHTACGANPGRSDLQIALPILLNLQKSLFRRRTGSDEQAY